MSFFFRFASCLRGEPRRLGRGGAVHPRYRRLQRHHPGCCKHAAPRLVYGDAAITAGLPSAGGATVGVPQQSPPGASAFTSPQPVPTGDAAAPLPPQHAAASLASSTAGMMPPTGAAAPRAEAAIGRVCPLQQPASRMAGWAIQVPGASPVITGAASSCTAPQHPPTSTERERHRVSRCRRAWH